MLNPLFKIFFNSFKIINFLLSIIICIINTELHFCTIYIFIFKGTLRLLQRSALHNECVASRPMRAPLPQASSERPSLGDLEPPDQLSNVSAKSCASVLEPSDLTITGRPGRDESYFTSRFGVTWGNAEKAAAPIAENIPIL